MKKIILVSIFILLILFGLFFIFKNKSNESKYLFASVDNKTEIENIPIISEISVIEKIKKKEIKQIKSEINIQNNQQIIVDKFKEDKKFIKDDISNFVQVSDKEIVRGEVLNNQCILNIVFKKSILQICDFVKNECSDVDCKMFDCIDYKNNWFKVSYYGDFAGSGDKEIIYKNKDEIIIANLECENKSLENYENELFQKLIK